MLQKTLIVFALVFSSVVSAQSFEKAVYEDGSLTLLEWAQMSDQEWKDRQAKQERIVRVCGADPKKLNDKDLEFYRSLECEGYRVLRPDAIKTDRI